MAKMDVLRGVPSSPKGGASPKKGAGASPRRGGYRSAQSPKKGARGQQAQAADANDEEDEEVTATQLPYAAPLSEAFKKEAAPLLAALSDATVRCLYSKEWKARLMAMRVLITRVRATAGRVKPNVQVDPLPPAHPDTLTLLGSVVVRGTADPNAKVYSSALDLLSTVVTHYLPGVNRVFRGSVSGADMLRDALGAVCMRTGDNKKVRASLLTLDHSARAAAAARIAPAL